jgi:archaemetzincin
VQRLALIPFFCPLSAAQLDQLAAHIEQAFPLRAERHAPTFDPQIAYDPQRGQYNSRVLMHEFIQDVRWQSSRVLGLTGLDLFIPVLTYVFGEAQLGGRVALVSSHRLDDVNYGLPAKPGRMLERVLKEAVHELGHTYQLLHCHDLGCVMSSSTTIDGIDVKSAHFCAQCERALRVEARG